MSNKNPYYKELKRYLAEVAVGNRSLDLSGLAKRVGKAQKSGVSSLDICELFSPYALSSPSYKQPPFSGARTMSDLENASSEMIRKGLKKIRYTRGPRPTTFP
jgi:hypothetical protein